MFYIVEQGARIQTPLEKLLGPEAVTQISATAATGRIDRHQPLHSAHPEFSKAYRDSQQERQQTGSLAIFAKQIMTQPAQCIDSTKSIDDAWAVFEQHRFHHLPIVDHNQQICGIVSDRDLLRFALSNRANLRVGEQKLSTIMQRSVITAEPDTEIRSIAEVMTQRRFGALPIVDQSRQVLGIVSSSDILRTLVNRASLELWV